MALLSCNQVIGPANHTADNPHAPLWRVLWMPGQGRAVLIDIDQPNAMPFWKPQEELEASLQDSLTILPDPKIALLKVDKPLTEAEERVRDNRMGVIRPLVEDPERLIFYAQHRNQAIVARSQETDTSPHHIRTWIRHYLQNGMIDNAVLPRFGKCGGPGQRKNPYGVKLGRPRLGPDGRRTRVGINVKPDDEQKILTAIPYLKMGLSYPAARQKVLENQYADIVIKDGVPIPVLCPEDQRPSLGQFRTWLAKTIEPGEIEKAALGSKRFALEKRELLGTSRNRASRPGEIYEIDATLMDVYVRRRGSADIIGRVWLYLVIDQYSCMIVGLAIDLDSPSWAVARLAFENAFTSKVDFCAKYGITISEDEWPCQHICDHSTADRGRDQIGKNAKNAGFELGFNLEILPACRGDLKDLVENSFALLSNFEKGMAGHVRYRKPGDKTCKLDGKYDLDQLTELMIQYCLKHNKSRIVSNPPDGYRPDDNVPPTPLQLWTKGCRDLGMPKQLPAEVVRQGLLHIDKGRETRHGFKFGRLHYEAEDGTCRHWFYGGRRFRNRKVRFDPRCVGAIDVLTDDGTFKRFVLVEGDRRYALYSRAEVEDAFAVARGARHKAEARAEEAAAELNAHKAAIEAEADDELATLPARPRNPKVNPAARATEQRELRRERAWMKPEHAEPTPKATETPAIAVPAAPVPPTAPSAAVINPRLALIKQQRAAALARHKGVQS